MSVASDKTQPRCKGSCRQWITAALLKESMGKCASILGLGRHQDWPLRNFRARTNKEIIKLHQGNAIFWLMTRESMMLHVLCLARYADLAPRGIRLMKNLMPLSSLLRRRRDAQVLVRTRHLFLVQLLGL
jgi:hypothetical protein